MNGLDTFSRIADSLEIANSTALFWRKKLPEFFSIYEQDGQNKLYDIEETSRKLKIIKELTSQKKSWKAIKQRLSQDFLAVVDIQQIQQDDNNAITIQQQEVEVLKNAVLIALENKKGIDFLFDEIKENKEEITLLQEENKVLSNKLIELENKILDITSQTKKKNWFSLRK